MKIAYLMQAGAPDLREDPPSGPSTHVKQVILELEKLGHKVRVLASFDGRQIWKSDDLVTFEPVAMPRLEGGPFRWTERMVRRVQYELHLPYLALFDGLRFAYACHQELRGYDLLYERMGWMGYGGALAGRWLGIPHVLEVNGDHLFELKMRGIPPKGLQRLFSVLLIRGGMKLSTHVVAAGQGWRASTIDVWQVAPDKVTAIENGTLMVSLLERMQLRSFQAHATTDTPTLVYLGAFDPWQGIPVLIRATSRALALGISLKLLLVGSGPEVNSARELVRECGIADRVTFTGHVSLQDAAGYLARADIGLSPYCGRTQYAGLKLFDYKAAGLATIASGKDGEPRTIEQGKTGWIVPPCDEDSLFQAIVTLCSNLELTWQIGRQARLEAEQLHGWDKTAEQLSELLTRIERNHREMRSHARRNESVQTT